MRDEKVALRKGGYTTNTNGNGNQENPEIEKIFEPLDAETQTVQDRWVEIDRETGEYMITFSEQIKDELGIEIEPDSDSN